jgi:hypothetical protein
MAIVASMLWRRLDTPGHDACSLERHDDGWSLHGMAVFRHENGPVRIGYSVQCDTAWQTASAQVRGAVGARRIDVFVARRGRTWTLNDSARPELEHLTDLDLAFTPATNLLHLRRVAIGNEAVRLPVAWLDVESGTLKELPQIYERRSDMRLSYRAPSVAYEGILELAPNGFVRRYPGLWEAESEL